MDEAMQLDNPTYARLGASLANLRGPGETKDDLIFGPAVVTRLSSLFREATRRLEYWEAGIYCRYQLRHCGASCEALSGFRPDTEIQARMQVKSIRTLKRYQQGGRIQQVWQTLSGLQQAHVAKCLANLYKILNNSLPPLE